MLSFVHRIGQTANNILTDVSAVLLLKIINSIILFGSIIFFARSLGSYEIGIFFLFQATVGFLGAFPADLGIKHALEKRVSESAEPGKYLSAAMFIKMILILLLILPLIGLQSTIHSYIGEEVTFQIVVGMILNEFFILFINFIKGKLRISLGVFLRVFRNLSWVTLGVLTIYFFDPIAINLINSYVLSYIPALIISLTIVHTEIESTSTDKIKSLFNFSKFAVIGYAGGYIYNWTDVAVIGFVLSQTYVGSYEIAWRISTLVMLLPGALRTQLFPNISNWYSNGNIRRINESLARVSVPILHISIPVLFGSVLFSDDILITFYGGEFEQASLVLIILLLDRIVRSFTWIINTILNGINMPKFSAVGTITSLIGNIVLNIILITFLGIEGAAIATFSSSCISLIIGYYFIKNIRYDINIPIQPYYLLWFIICSLIMMIPLFFIDKLMNDYTPIELSLIILVGVCIYIPLSIYPQKIRTQLRSLLSE